MQITLKAARVNAGLTQKQVAKAIGKNDMTIASWEKGKTVPDVVTLYELCKLYKIPIDSILIS